MQEHEPKSIRKRKKQDEENYYFSGYVPTKRRKSERLRKTKPKYSYEDLDRIYGFDKLNDGERDLYMVCINSLPYTY